VREGSILPVDIIDEVQASYLDYAMSVIVSRALPDVRDGLKPVHRRILYSMYASGFLHDKPYKKSARTIGDVVGKYHPHGDSAVYDSLVRMAQRFAMRAPLIDGQGNFGSIDGDPPAAMRYTEARLAKISSKLVQDINLDSVDFKVNYDGSEREPVVLPSVVPNLLLNGSGGIAVGMATNIPPHNLGQIVNACCLYVDNKDVAIEELIDAIEGPDFPTYGSVVGIANLHKAYKTGKGIITIKGKVEIEERASRQQAIIVTEIPYAVNKARFIERVAELAKEGRIEGISDLRDESDSSGIRVVMELKKDAIASVVINQLYSYSQLRVSYGINMLALDKGVPKLMNLKDVIAAFINFRREVIYRRTCFLLVEAKRRGEILIGLLVAISNVDRVVRIIRESKDVASARESLISTPWEFSDVADFIELVSGSTIVNGKFYFSEAQAKAILEMRLARLTGLEKKKLSEELASVAKHIAEYELIISSPLKLMTLLKEELLEVKAEFATPRLTKIDPAEEESLEEDDLIPEEEMVVTFTVTGYVKRVQLSTYTAQKRGGKGKLALQMLEGDAISNIIVGSTHVDLLFFSDVGQVYKIKLRKLPLASLQAKGKPIANLLPIARQERINNILSLPRYAAENLDVVFATARGQVRRNKLSDFGYIPSNGKLAMRLEEGDKLVSVKFTEPEKDILLATSKGKCIRFSIEDLRVFKSRSSDGVRGIKISSDDSVVGQAIVSGESYTQEERELYLSIPLETRLQFKLKQQNLQALQAISARGIVEGGLSLEKIERMAQEEEFVLSITENGYGKCTSAYEYRRANRGGSGVVNVAVSARVGRVVALELISGSSDEELMVITNMGKVIRCKADEIRITGRNTSGVILVKMKKGEQVVSAALIRGEITSD
jgi:DNA gyrase subunit A